MTLISCQYEKLRKLCALLDILFYGGIQLQLNARFANHSPFFHVTHRLSKLICCDRNTMWWAAVFFLLFRLVQCLNIRRQCKIVTDPNTGECRVCRNSYHQTTTTKERQGMVGILNHDMIVPKKIIEFASNLFVNE